MNLFYLTLLMVIFCVCATLIFHKDYDDGIVGKVALGAMGGAAAIVLLSTMLDGEKYEPLKVHVLLVFGVTVFLLRYAYRWGKWKLTCGKQFGWKRRTDGIKGMTNENVS